MEMLNKVVNRGGSEPLLSLTCNVLSGFSLRRLNECGMKMHVFLMLTGKESGTENKDQPPLRIACLL